MTCSGGILENMLAKWSSSLTAKTERGIAWTDLSFGNGMAQTKRRTLLDECSNQQSGRGRKDDLFGRDIGEHVGQVAELCLT